MMIQSLLRSFFMLPKKTSRFITKQVRSEYYTWRYENKCPDCDSSGFGETDVCTTCRGLGLQQGISVPPEFVDVCIDEFLDVVIISK